MSRLIPGVSVTLGGDEYVIPPLNLRLYFDNPDGKPAPEAVNPDVLVVLNPKAHSTEEYTRATLGLLVPTLQRNYPDFTLEKALEIVAFADCPALCMAMLTNAGFAKKAPLAAAAPAAEPQPEAKS